MWGWQGLRAIGIGLAFLALAACGVAPEKRGPAPLSDIRTLQSQIMALGPEVDPEEAARAAEIAFSYTRELAIQYQITDPPLIHNTKVNMGLKPRGLCWHWAEDMERRLKAEGFQTLDMHRAIANADNAFRIEHSTAIVSRKGDAYLQGIVLDPWRLGGTLTFVPVLEDPDYRWDAQQDVLRRKRERQLARQGLAAQS